MSTQLFLGVAGAAIGFATGGVGFIGLGFLAGTLVGSLIDPPKVEGPRLHDLKLQVSTYGKMIPYVWGTGRIAGNCIDQTDLIEHKEKSGGKGGPEITTYTYSASFDILLCVGPILGVRRIWADTRLIWDDSTGEPMPCTLYLGDPVQTPDPTFEAIHGVGNVPGYNGFSHVVFSDYLLTDFGNRIPQLEFEIFTKVGVFPWRVSEFVPDPDLIPNHGARCSLYANGVLTVGNYVTASLPQAHYYEHTFDIYGVEDTGLAFDADLSPSVVASTAFAVTNLLAAACGGGWYVRDQLATVITCPYGVAGQTRIYNNGFIFTTGEFFSGTAHCGMQRFPATNGIISSETEFPDKTVDLGVANGAGSNPSVSSFVLGNTNVTDCVYLYNGTSQILYEYAFDLQSINRQWDLTSVNAVQSLINGFGFTVYLNSSGNLILACDRGTAGGKNMGAFYLNSDLTTTFIGSVAALNGAPPGSSPFIATTTQMGHSGYVIVEGGVLSLIPPVDPVPLSEIVAALTELTPLGGGSPLMYDVDELIDDVRWFAVASQMTVRNAIQTLRPPFFFDAVESDDVVVFKKRGGAARFSVPDSSLCGRSYGEPSGDPLRTVRKREQGLPRTVTMTYYDVDADYQTGAQSSPRQVTLSEQDVALDIPVGFTASEALQKCWAIQAAEWIGRESFEWSTTRGGQVLDLLTGLPVPACMMETCDVVIVRGREIRIEKDTRMPNGVIKWSGVLSAPSIYTQSASSGIGGFVPQESPGSSVVTELVLLDIPILSQHDAPFGFYAAMGPATVGRWTGATLFKSLDQGVTYNSVAASNVASVIGVTSSTAGGSPSISGVLASYGPGDVIDESELCVVLTDEDSELESCTTTGLANGLNLCAISRGVSGSPGTLQWELLQFRDATLVASRTYVLKGFLRGRKESLTSGHAIADTFVLLPVTNVDAPESELNKSFKYKAVSFGSTLASAVAQDFINTGLSTGEFYDTENRNLPVFIGCVGSPGDGVKGLVPAPGDGDCYPLTYLDARGIWSVPSATSSLIVLTVAYAASVTIDLAAYATYSHVVVNVGTLTGNITFNITNGQDGQIIRARFKQDGTGSRIFTAGAALRFSTDLPSLVLSTAINKKDHVAFEWDGTDSKADFVAPVKGF